MSTVEPESEREMVITRLVQAPRRRVWQAFTTAENLGRWWGPDGFRTTTSEFELRPGGRWIHLMHGPDGTDYPNQITWREIVPPERLTYLHAGDDGHAFESSITLDERGEATLVTMRALFPTRAERDLVVERYRADEGGEQTLSRLAALCEAPAGPKGSALMPKLRVHAFGISLDGYGAGPGQSLDHPMGVGGMALHQWVFGTKTFQKMAGDFAGSLIGDQVGREGVDDDFAARGFENLGAWIMGRNMFGPLRGPWSDDRWKGWWGDNPPYHVPVFVLTHHARAPLTMEGGTTFHFVTDGIHAALGRAREAAQGKDIRLGGGVATLRQYLTAGLIDEIHLVCSPVLLGTGEHLLAGIDTASLGYKCTEHASSEHVTHVVLTKSLQDHAL